MNAADTLAMVAKATEAGPACEGLASLREAAALADGLDSVGRSELNRAMLVLLAKRETVNPLRLGLAREWNISQARHALLAHLYSDDFYPTDTERVSAWTDTMRAEVCFTLAHLRAEPAIPIVTRELRLWASGDGGGLIARVAGLFQERPVERELEPILGNEPPVHARTFREFMILFQCLAMLQPAEVGTVMERAVMADARYGLPAPGGASMALYAGVGALMASKGDPAALEAAVAAMPPRRRGQAQAAAGAAMDFYDQEFGDGSG